MLDIAADELDIDPVEIRRRNFIPTDAFPYTTLTGATYDSRRLREAARRRCSSTRATTSCAPSRPRAASATTRSCSASACRRYVEITAPVGLYREWGKVEIDDDGTVLAYVGTSSHGQGHETAFSMIVSDVLGVPMEQITILQSDTQADPAGWRHRRLALAADRGQRAEGRERRGARRRRSNSRRTCSRRTPTTSCSATADSRSRVCRRATLSWADLATAVKDDARRPESMEARLAHELTFDAGSSSFPFGAHIAVVEIDRETGRVELLRHIAVDDCGRIVNPLLVKGQQHGGIAQGVAQVLYEHVQYDEDANPVTGNLMDYAMPSAAEFPSYEVYNTETPSPLNPLGAKGIGESATIGSTPAVHNAVVDALSHLGVRHVDMPCTAERVWRALQDADAGVHERARFATPTLRLTESQYRTIVGALLRRACRTRRAACSPGPSVEDVEPTGVDHRGAPDARTRTRRR